VTAVAVFLAAAAVLAATWRTLCADLEGLLGSSLRSAASGTIAPSAALEQGVRVLVLAVAPVLFAAVGAALLAGFAQTGPVLSGAGLRPELKHLSPTRNLPRVFGRAAFVELLKNLIKLTGIGYLGATALREKLPTVLTPRLSPSETLLAVADCLGTIAVRVGILLVILAAADLLYERRSFFKRMRMTKLEVQREMKESEGDPHHKAERKRVHQEILAHEMIEGVATADCVVINPEHVAVAIRYDADSMEAPRVVASGRRLLAARIREIARQKGIPIVRNVPLARALVEIELDQEIPAELYQAVAEVLRFVYGLTRQDSPPRSGGEPRGRRV
jgi:flagellar biosynthetic protein FlhB